jgi:hypothetical protein
MEVGGERSQRRHNIGTRVLCVSVRRRTDSSQKVIFSFRPTMCGAAPTARGAKSSHVDGAGDFFYPATRTVSLMH